MKNDGPEPSRIAWKPGSDYPHLLRLAGDVTIAVSIPSKWVVVDRSGEVCFTPPAVRMLDRIHVLFDKMDRPLSPGFLSTLRQSIGLTQAQFGGRIGVDKMTVSRWERGTMRPSPTALKAIKKLRQSAIRRGIVVSPPKAA